MALSPEVINALRAEIAHLRSQIDSIDQSVAKLQAARADLLRQIDPIEKITAEVKADVQTLALDVKVDVKADGGRPSPATPSPMPVSSVEPAQATPRDSISLKDKLHRPMKSGAWAI